MKYKGKLLGLLLPLLCFGVIMIMSSWRNPMWMDEYVFYRLSSGLPNYSTTDDWFFKDRPTLLNPSATWSEKSSEFLDKKEAFDWIYNNPVYFHSPFAPILVWPVVKLLNTMADNNIIPHIEEQEGYPVPVKDNTDQLLNMQAETMTKILRMIPILLFLASMFLAYKISYKRFGKASYFYAVPLAASVQLFAGVYLFYWDVFMMFFFVLALYLLENKHENWALVVACCLVNTKMFIDVLFLIPLIVKNRKMIWALLAFIPYYIFVAISGGNILYPILHYLTGQGIVSHNYVYSLYNFAGWLYLFVMLGTPVFLATTVPLFWRIKKYPEYITLWLCANLYAWGSGMGIAHLSCLPYVGVLIFPIVVYEFKLDSKFSDWLGKVARSDKKNENYN